MSSLSNRARRKTGKRDRVGHLRSLRLLARVGIKLNNQNNSNICHGAETNCRIAHILGILLMNSCNTDKFLATTIICSLSALNLFQRTLIDELSFDSESVKDFLAARHFPAEFQLYHDRATRQYKKETVL